MLKITKPEDIANAKTSELVEWYNANVDGPPVKKFVNRATAERRVGMLYDAIKDEPAQPAPKAPTSSGDRAAAIAASWNDPEVAAKRKQRSAVIVDGTEYRSVSAAFKALDLPVKEEIRFRMKLKEVGELEAYGRTWKIKPLNY